MFKNSSTKLPEQSDKLCMIMAIDQIGLILPKDQDPKEAFEIYNGLPSHIYTSSIIIHNFSIQFNNEFG